MSCKYNNSMYTTKEPEPDLPYELEDYMDIIINNYYDGEDYEFDIIDNIEYQLFLRSCGL